MKQEGMEHILNELSLTGQYSSVDDFVKNGALPLADVLAEINQFGGSLLYKKSDFYQCKALPNKTFYEIVFACIDARWSDELRMLKSKMASLMNHPFWDTDPKQKETAIYLMVDESGNESNVSGTSVAEAFVRKACLVSFNRSAFEKTIITVKSSTDDADGNVNNVWQKGQVCEVLRNAGFLSIPDYIVHTYSGKLDFSQIGARNGLELINSENLSLFGSAFKKFNQLSWPLINVDDGLDYKEFEKNRRTRGYFPDEIWNKGVKKFRVDQEKRCFGYVENGTFYVIRIDLDHKLSDLG